MTPSDQPNRLIFVTGLSGAGKSTALKALEDSGFETVDNLPLSIMESVIQSILPERELAIGIDCRSLGFSAKKFSEILDHATAIYGIRPSVLFMDADPAILIQRFSETRRRHPLSQGLTIEDGIRSEQNMLQAVRKIATHTFDTSHSSTTDTRNLIRDRVGSNQKSMIVTLMSFGYSNGIPRGADLVFDVRFLKNPHYEPSLKPLTGRDAAVQDFVKSDPDFKEFAQKIEDLLAFLLPRYEEEGKSYLTIAFGCTGGRHRSVTLAEYFTERLKSSQLDINCWHRDSIQE